MSPPASESVIRPSPAPDPAKPDGGDRPLTPSELSRLAASIFTTGPFLFRQLQRFRPFICPFEALIPHVPAGASVLDVGCGGGLWLHLLTATGRLGSGLGFDSSAGAIALASGAIRAGSIATEDVRTEASLRFVHLDVRAPWPGDLFDVVSIIDVLHHVPVVAQRKVIELACERVSAGGVLVYKDMCRRPVWRAWMNRLHDLVLARQWINYARIEDVEAWAVAAGLVVERQSSISRWWYGHELLVLRRPNA